VALGYRSRASVARPHPQRHITWGATEEIKLDGYRAIAVRKNKASPSSLETASL
jgi:hypothetical protein